MRDVFRELGRRAEQFKQDMDGAAAENADYECKECESRFAVKPEQCPDCGSEETTLAENEERAS
jgi:rRNA maturation endonuclease Nob1